jgi:hypothetical protein
VHVRLAAAPAELPAVLLASGERAGLLTSVAGDAGFAVVRNEAIANEATLSLADGTAVEPVAAPVPSRPIGRP